MAAAYAALLSLARSLRQILNLGQQYVDPLHRFKIVSLHEKVESFIAFLEDYSDKYGGTPDLARDGIRNAAYHAQDFMDSYLCLVSTGDDSSSIHWHKMSLDRDLNIAFERISFIWEEAAKMKNNPAEDLRLRPITYSSQAGQLSTAKSRVVGFEDDLNTIKERLYEDSAVLQVIPIVGMGGIGKTTLARKAYEDSLRAHQFDICAWITVSQQYQRRQILSGLLRDLKKPVLGQPGPSDAQLATLVYQNLKGRRYLVVIDDVWSNKAWDDVKMLFPEDGIKSRILLTTRLSDVAVHAGSSNAPFHQMKLLNEDQSWKLLREMIFGQESCPLQLVEIGKKTARNCRGLPLTIVVVAGLLLSKEITMQEWWENVSENISSTEPSIALHCSNILCLSYDRLPLRLKPCFLYISAFSEDSEIQASKLIKLWVAEGFLKPSDQSKCLEDVGERFLEDLVRRSLILVIEKGTDGKIQTIGIHDLLREICIAKAEEEAFLHHVSSIRNDQIETIEDPNRRLNIHCTQNRQEWRILDSSVRTVLLFRDMYWGPILSLCCRRISVLHIPQVTWPKLAEEISTLVNLRYISFSFNYASRPDAASISKLPNLETIIAHNTDLRALQVPYEILEMPKLRHLIMNTSFVLSRPSNTGIIHESDLQTLETVINFRFTEEAIKMLVNLKKLIVEFHVTRAKWDDLNLDNLLHLTNLEELKVSVFKFPNFSKIWNHSFPISLKNLTLENVPLPWENMTIIGSLPNLQVLEMMHMDVEQVSEWTPTEGQFCLLKYFRSSLDNLVSWEVEREHFPRLEILCLKGARWIDEIPCGIGEIDSLQLIELWHCPVTLVDSAKRIQEQQHDNGNDAFEVLVHGS
ncbi:putative late blight resistance protein homolog R1A-3 [Primulina eburnea]|uniref:putative late blight resistance protein homolog R1A-3 n=1 Tax=Primulina eburnea TaxID=1245227 RepID=UPI003C6C3C10